MMKALILAIAILASPAALLGGAPSAHAEPGWRKATARERARIAQAPDKGSREEKLARKREKIVERIRSLRAWKLTEALALDEATAAKLFPILSRYDAKLDELGQERHALMMQMRGLAEAGGAGAGAGKAQNNAQMNALIDKLMAHQRKVWALQEERINEVRKVLSPEQTVQIMVLLPEIDRKIQKQLRRVMGKGGKDKPGKNKVPLEP